MVSVMDNQLLDYVGKRIESQAAAKQSAFEALEQVNRAADKQTSREEEIMEKKMAYYLACGALAELLELKSKLGKK
ncbi:hypothetical protein SAMN05421736_112101 [Evansella caseinilytica]|uniref:Uncharacterized protein n=1 Tax=Evansella caseinilytica TaxID=1503961 RepID=A0A1H3SZG7_9BACI|nr:hypothetical protein SAMN05421736_112101 [Evansella caseinilytica]